MQFESNRKNRLIKESVGLKDGSVSNVFVNQYPNCVNFYTSPPFGKISLEESEDMVEERLNRSLFNFFLLNILRIVLNNEIIIVLKFSSSRM